MDDQEHDYLRQEIRKLQQSNRRWKLVSLALAAALVIGVIASGVSSFMFSVVEMRRQREVLVHLEEARAKEAAARAQAEQEAPRPRPVDKEKAPKEEDAKQGGAAGARDNAKPGKTEAGPGD